MADKITPTGRVRILLQREEIRANNRSGYPTWTQLHMIRMDENTTADIVADIVGALERRVKEALGIPTPPPVCPDCGARGYHLEGCEVYETLRMSAAREAHEALPSRECVLEACIFHKPGSRPPTR